MYAMGGRNGWKSLVSDFIRWLHLSLTCCSLLVFSMDCQKPSLVMKPRPKRNRAGATIITRLYMKLFLQGHLLRKKKCLKCVKYISFDKLWSWAIRAEILYPCKSNAKPHANLRICLAIFSALYVSLLCHFDLCWRYRCFRVSKEWQTFSYMTRDWLFSKEKVSILRLHVEIYQIRRNSEIRPRFFFQSHSISAPEDEFDLNIYVKCLVARLS